MGKQKIFFIEKEFRTHPTYRNYAASADGEIYSLLSNKVLKPRDNGNGYKMINVFDKNKNKYRNYYIHRMVWECFHGLIPKGLHADHWNNVRDDNRLVNLQLLSPKENQNKSHNKKVIAINLDTDEEKLYISIKIASEKIGIDSKRICDICRKKLKSATSKTSGQKYFFRYA